MSGCQINPCCTCDPCQCAVPCTCGLVQVGSTIDQQWDAGAQELTYTVTSRFRPALPPVPTTSTGHHHGDHGTDHGQDTEAPLGEPGEILDAVGNPATIGRSVLARTPPPPHAHDSAPSAQASLRRTVYRGHAIEIRTSYDVFVDGARLEAHMGVSDGGNVHYHGLPNYSAASAIDVVRQVVDSFPDDYPVTGHADEQADDPPDPPGGDDPSATEEAAEGGR